MTFLRSVWRTERGEGEEENVQVSNEASRGTNRW